MPLITARRGAATVLLLLTAAVTGGAARADGGATAWPTPLTVPSATIPAAADPVLPALDADAAVPTTDGLAAQLDPLLAATALGDQVHAVVVDVATGTTLLDRDGATAATPASATKILTGAAALSVLGPDTTLPTTAEYDAASGTLYLVGGGDVMLAPDAGDADAVMGHAGLGDLARAAAATLAGQGVTSVTVALDDTLLTGGSVNEAWASGDVTGGFVAPVQAVEVTVGSTDPDDPPDPGMPADRLSDPALSAAESFADLLAAAGLDVTGDVSRAAAPDGATAVGEVRSATVADIVEHDLTDSDNTTAEVLARLVAGATGRATTFEDGAEAVVTAVGDLGVDVDQVTLTGGSGLGSGTEIPAATIASVLVTAASDDHDDLRTLLAGLPVAGASGTLEDRFVADGQQQAAGRVRAKTGTLTGVGSLAGTVVDADGRQLAFAVITNSGSSTSAARTALDAVATALVGCGCG